MTESNTFVDLQIKSHGISTNYTLVCTLINNSIHMHWFVCGYILLQASYNVLIINYLLLILILQIHPGVGWQAVQ